MNDNLVDIETLPVIDVWGGSVRARRLDGERLTLAVVELEPGPVVPAHQHENEQIGMVITGSITFTIGEDTRELGPGGTWRTPASSGQAARGGSRRVRPITRASGPKARS